MKFLRRCLPLAAFVLSGSPWLVLSAAPAPSVTIGHNFAGISYGTSTTNSSALPPDSNGEIGPNDYVEFVNGIFAVYSKTNGHRRSLKTDLDFWAAAGVGIDVGDGTSGVSDPRIIYDPASQRWFASQVDFDYQIDFDTLTVTLSTNDFLLAISVTSDPNGEWIGASIPSDPDGQYFADFPTLGVDSQGVYLAADMFDSNGDPSTAPDLGCGLLSFPKSDLLASPPDFSTRTWHGVMSFDQRGQIYQPTICHDGSAVGRILAAGDIGTDSDFHSNIVTFAVHNVAGPGAATLGPSTFLTVPPYMVPYNAALDMPMFTALQPDGSTTLQANDARFAGRAYTTAGVLYGAHNTELNGRIAIRWYRINAANGSLLEVGTIADPNLDLFFPSIAANPGGVVVIAYNSSGLGSAYISSYASVGQTVGGVTTFGSPLLLQPGLTSYHGDDEDPSGELGNPVSRWGDYSTTSVDPSDPNRFWTIQMYPSDTDVWSTQITELVTTPLAVLSIMSAGTNITVSWPNAAGPYHLQFAPNLLSSITWSNVTQIPQTNGSQAYVVLPHSAGRQFFRLTQ